MKRGLPCISAPTFSAWKPSTSFSGAMASSTASESKCFGSGSCTRMPCTVGSALSSAMRLNTTAGSTSGAYTSFSERMPAFSQAATLLRT
jgi:hypothetical protein